MQLARVAAAAQAAEAARAPAIARMRKTELVTIFVPALALPPPPTSSRFERGWRLAHAAVVVAAACAPSIVFRRAAGAGDETGAHANAAG